MSRCKHERAPLHATFCPDCGARLILQRGEVKVPVPKRKGNLWFSQMMVGGQRVYISAETEQILLPCLYRSDARYLIHT